MFSLRLRTAQPKSNVVSNKICRDFLLTLVFDQRSSLKKNFGISKINKFQHRFFPLDAPYVTKTSNSSSYPWSCIRLSAHYSQKRYYTSPLPRVDSHKSVSSGNVFSVSVADSSVIQWLLVAAIVGATMFSFFANTSEAKEDLNANRLPSYTKEDVREHNCKDKGIWVTYKDGVYDITEFIETHPGGKKILLASGASLEPFWALYQNHNTEEVLAILSRYRIGNLLHTEPGDTSDRESSDPYANEPSRHPALVVQNPKPFNAETPNAVLGEFITPNELFYVRNHLPVPLVDPTQYRLKIEGKGVSELSLSLNEIKSFPKYTVTATLQCAGNRRNEMTEIKGVRGGKWDSGAIGNANWSGARLIDVLKSAGLNMKEAREWIEHHVVFEGLDSDFEKNYGASIPLRTALADYSEVILAYEMNGETLPLDHGYPIRVIIPGTVGARNVKWLGKVAISEEESYSHWQRFDYKGFSPSVDWHNVEWDKAASIQELPVTSVITEPADGSSVSDLGEVEVKGIAYSGGGRGIERVDVSMDGGDTWQVATLSPRPPQPYNQVYAWSPWSIHLPYNEGTKEMEIIVKAVDSSYNNQPERIEPIWNLRGVLTNSWHRIKVNIGDE